MRRILVLSCALASACLSSTGSDVVTFHSYAAGPADAGTSGALVFDSGRKYHVTLTRAVVHVGGIYLNRSVPLSGAQDTSCVLPGAYVAQAGGQIDVDVLSAAQQELPGIGQGTETPALAGEVWLTGGDVDAPDDATVVVDLAGTAERDGYVIAFDGKLTIGKNRATAPTDPSLPGSKPICKQRIVSPILTDITPRNGGYLVLRIDPRPWFANVDFLDGINVLPPAPASLSYTFPDVATDQPDINLYQAIHASAGVYSFDWVHVRLPHTTRKGLS